MQGWNELRRNYEYLAPTSEQRAAVAGKATKEAKAIGVERQHKKGERAKEYMRGDGEAVEPRMSSAVEKLLQRIKRDVSVTDVVNHAS